MKNSYQRPATLIVKLNATNLIAATQIGEGSGNPDEVKRNIWGDWE